MLQRELVFAHSAIENPRDKRVGSHMEVSKDLGDIESAFEDGLAVHALRDPQCGDEGLRDLGFAD